MIKAVEEVDTALRMIIENDNPVGATVASSGFVLADAISTMPDRLKDLVNLMNDAYLPNEPRGGEQFRVAISEAEKAGAALRDAFAHLAAMHTAVEISGVDNERTIE